jgi:hypothetical protein
LCHAPKVAQRDTARSASSQLSKDRASSASALASDGQSSCTPRFLRSVSPILLSASSPGGTPTRRLARHPAQSRGSRWLSGKSGRPMQMQFADTTIGEAESPRVTICQNGRPWRPGNASPTCGSATPYRAEAVPTLFPPLPALSQEALRGSALCETTAECIGILPYTAGHRTVNRST